MTPKRIRLGDRANFDTLLRAASNGDVAAVSAIRKADGKNVVLVCAMQTESDSISPVPLAVMIEGNPYELFEDPTI